MVFLGIKSLSLHICQRYNKVEWICKSLSDHCHHLVYLQIVVFQYIYKYFKTLVS